MKKIFLLAGLLMCLCLPVTMAADWYYVGKIQDGTTYFIDNANVQKSKDEAIVWVKMIEPDGKETKLRWQFKRWDRTLKVLYMFEYDANGNIVSSEAPYNAEIPIVPDTVGDMVYNVIWREI